MSSVKNFKNICFLAAIVLSGCGVQASYNEGEECYAEGGEFWRCEKTQYCDRTGEIPQCMAAGEICENSKDKGNDNGFGYCLPGASCQNGSFAKRGRFYAIKNALTRRMTAIGVVLETIVQAKMLE